MNHKQLLALFLCFVVILSSRIVSKSQKETIVSVKDVINNNDNIHIENINEENGKYKIDVFYPVTDKIFVNEKVKKIVEHEIAEAKDKNKNLKISFEKLDYDKYKTIMLNIRISSDNSHIVEKIESIVYNDEKLFKLKDIIKQENVENMDNYIIEYIKNNNEFNKIYNKEMVEKKLKNIENMNFALTDSELILIFNPNELLPNVAGIIQFGIPYEILKINLD